MNNKCPLTFLREMIRGIPRGIGFGSPDACERFRYALDARSADILKNRKTRKLLFLQDNGSRTKICFHYTETTHRKDEDDRKDHEKISCVHQNLIL